HFEPRQFFRILRRQGITWYSGGPTYQKAIYGHGTAHPEEAEGIRFAQIRVETAALEPEIADGLERLFSTRISTSYGSTESGRVAFSCPAVGLRKVGTVGFSVERLGFEGSEVRIRSLDGEFLPVGKRGEIVVRGPQVFDGYENDEAANAAAFVDGWYRTGDEGYFDEDGYLALTGRIKEIINRGGEKVSPAEVDSALMSHPDVRDAATFPLRHPTLGEEVAAAVVPAPGAGLTDQALTRYLLNRLTGFKVPRRFYFVAEVPKSDAGKVQRYKLAEALGVSKDIGAQRATVSDREATPQEAQLQAIWTRILGLPDVGLDDNFLMLGGDSLQAVELFMRIEQVFGRRLPRSVLFEAGTVAEMARRIEETTPSPCLVPIQPKGRRPPFFCVHDGNGEVLNYRHLGRLVGEAQPFYGIQCLGLDGESVPFTRIEKMAAYYVDEIKKVQPVGPYYFGGYSFGGRVAYVMAQQLRAADEQVALLALFDTASGHGQRHVSSRDWLAHHRERMKSLPASEVPAYLWLRASNLAGMIYMATRIRCFALAWRLLESFRWPVPRFMRRPVPANDMIRRTYRAKPYDGDATLFTAERYAWTHADAHDGWRELIRGKLDIRPISGQHFEIVDPPHVQILARELSRALQRAQAVYWESPGLSTKAS
ncbi:MAG: thioesterase domain-containing protein, partial [Alphaproteobacteria bacterium]